MGVAEAVKVEGSSKQNRMFCHSYLHILSVEDRDWADSIIPTHGGRFVLAIFGLGIVDLNSLIHSLLLINCKNL